MFRKVLPLLLAVMMAVSACGKLDVNVNYKNAELGWVEITGFVLAADGTPMAGEGVFCQQVSQYPVGLCSGTRYTNADGSFSFGPVLLHDSDELMLWAFTSTHDQLELTRSGTDTAKQPSFEFVLPERPTPVPITQSENDLGWVTITGTVRDSSNLPVAGAIVFCRGYSPNGVVYVFSNRHTNLNGSYTCDPIYLRDADQISVQALTNGYAIQEMVRAGAELRGNTVLDFAFSQQVTPTAPSAVGTCPVPTAETQLMINTEDGYCLLYPVEAVTRNPRFIVINPTNNPGDMLGDFWSDIRTEDAAGRTASQVADASIASVGPGFNINRFDMNISGERAVVVDGLPGQDSVRYVYINHNNRLYVLAFTPWMPGVIGSQQLTPVEHFYKTIIESLRFLP